MGVSELLWVLECHKPIEKLDLGQDGENLAAVKETVRTRTVGTTPVHVFVAKGCAYVCRLCVNIAISMAATIAWTLFVACIYGYVVLLLGMFSQ